MRILISGGAGFVGSNLALTLQTQFPQAEITVIDDFSGGTFRNLRGFRGNVVAKNILDLPQSSAFSFDYVFHLAGITDTRVEDQSIMCLNNIEGFRRLSATAYTSNTETRVIYASSASVYGVRGDSAPFRESDELDPANVYAFSKIQLENIGGLFAKSGFKNYGVRFFNVFGLRESHKTGYSSMIHQMTKAAKEKRFVRLFEDGEQVRDFVSVKDVVSMLIRLMEYNGEERVFNCGSGQVTSFNRIAKEIASEDRIIFDKCPYGFFQPYTCADMSLAKKELDFAPEHSTFEHIKEYIDELKTGNH